jgi:hypothetical protein
MNAAGVAAPFGIAPGRYEILVLARFVTPLYYQV